MTSSEIAAAIAAMERALAERPDDAVLRYRLGSTLAAAGRLTEAVDHLRRAVALRPGSVEAPVALGNALNLLRRPGEALDAFLAARAEAPSSAAAAYGAGLASRGMGRLADARSYFEQAVALAPDHAGYHLALSECGTFERGDPRLPPLEDLARREASLPAAARVHLRFALAKAYDDLGRFAEAFDRLAQGNALVRASQGYDEAFALAAMARMATGYETRTGLAGRGDPSDLPVFVFGMPRSGTSLVEQILASHPRVFGAGEIPLFNACVKAAVPDAERVFSPATLQGHVLRRIGGRYVEALRAEAPDAARIVNKLPGNVLFAGLIHLALPGARMVHVRRDPRDTCFSCYSKLFAAGNAFAYDLAEVGRYHRAHDALMAHWRKVLPPDRLIEVEYEALVADPQAEARRLIAHLGLDWDARCLDFHRTERGVFTLSAFQVRRPIHAGSVGRWRRYGDRLGPLLAALGTQVDGQNR